MNAGYFSLGNWNGVPVRMHWTAPLGALVFGGFHILPGYWIGFLALIFIHEMGHAMVVKACRQYVLSIDITGFGGLCRWTGTVTPMQRSMIAWGGVWAQAVLMIATYLVLLFVPVTESFFAQLVFAFTSTNRWIMLINLLPVPPLDGYEAWPLFGHLKRRWQSSRSQKPPQRRDPPPPPPPPPAAPAPPTAGAKDQEEVERNFKKMIDGILTITEDQSKKKDD